MEEWWYIVCGWLCIIQPPRYNYFHKWLRRTNSWIGLHTNYELFSPLINRTLHFRWWWSNYLILSFILLCYHCLYIHVFLHLLHRVIVSFPLSTKQANMRGDSLHKRQHDSNTIWRIQSCTDQRSGWGGYLDPNLEFSELHN